MANRGKLQTLQGPYNKRGPSKYDLEEEPNEQIQQDRAERIGRMRIRRWRNPCGHRVERIPLG
jgi:hypothetical protein